MTFNSKVTLAMTSGFTLLSGVAYISAGISLLWFLFLGSGAFTLGTLVYAWLNR